MSEPGKVADLAGSEGSNMIDVTGLFKQFGVQKNIRGFFNRHTYEIDPRAPENNWLYPAFRGFEVLQRNLAQQGKNVHTFATIGTGAGWDAVGAYHIFKPERLVATDYHPKVLPIAHRNIRGNVPTNIEVLTLTGDLCAPLREEGVLADVIYANLPLLPDDPEKVMQNMRSSTFVAWERIHAAPEDYRRHRLAMKYHFLLDAASSLTQGGSVVINLGGRVPVELVQQMFTDCGYTYEELFTMLKIQSQPEEVLPGFAQAERETGVTFDYYRLSAAKASLQEHTPPLSAADLKAYLLPHHVSATQAQALHEQGEEIGHIVQVIRGQRVHD